MSGPLLRPEVRQFLREHRHDDPYELALRPEQFAGLPMASLAAQIHARQKAASKIPSWAGRDDLIWPPILSMEQCSSERTARYKAGRVRGRLLVDLSGGAGVDTFFLRTSFEKTVYVERDPALCDIARHNFGVMQAGVEVVNADAGHYAEAFAGKADLFYLDPARRDPGSRQRFFRIGDFQPNPAELAPLLLRKAVQVLVKLSPMADPAAILDLFPSLQVLEVLSVRNEVKELLCLLGEAGGEPLVRAVDLAAGDRETMLEFRPSEEPAAHCDIAQPMEYLFEPGRAVLKAGAFRLPCQRFGVAKLHPNTHLYTSGVPISNFPGRCYQLLGRLKPRKEEVRKAIPAMRARVAVRNYPEEAAVLRKRLGLLEGGEDHLFGATLADGRPALLHCRLSGDQATD